MLLIGVIVGCLSIKEIPYEANMVEILQLSKMWVNVERHYFKQGGMIYAIIATIFDYIKLYDLEVGHTIIDVGLEEYYKGILKY